MRLLWDSPTLLPARLRVNVFVYVCPFLSPKLTWASSPEGNEAHTQSHLSVLAQENEHSVALTNTLTAGRSFLTVSSSCWFVCAWAHPTPHQQGKKKDGWGFCQSVFAATASGRKTQMHIFTSTHTLRTFPCYNTLTKIPANTKRPRYAPGPTQHAHSCPLFCAGKHVIGLMWQQAQLQHWSVIWDATVTTVSLSLCWETVLNICDGKRERESRPPSRHEITQSWQREQSYLFWNIHACHVRIFCLFVLHLCMCEFMCLCVSEDNSAPIVEPAEVCLLGDDR